MRRLPLVLILLVTVVCPFAIARSTATSGPHISAGATPVRLLAFRGHFGGFHLGGGLRRSRFGSGTFGRRGGSRGLFRRIARALAFAYILLIHMFRRRRRNRYAY
jgi:hypothetical protein